MALASLPTHPPLGGVIVRNDEADLVRTIGTKDGDGEKEEEARIPEVRRQSLAHLRVQRDEVQNLDKTLTTCKKLDNC